MGKTRVGWVYEPLSKPNRYAGWTESEKLDERKRLWKKYSAFCKQVEANRSSYSSSEYRKLQRMLKEAYAGLCRKPISLGPTVNTFNSVVTMPFGRGTCETS
jgi:phosphoketolase